MRSGAAEYWRCESWRAIPTAELTCLAGQAGGSPVAELPKAAAEALRTFAKSKDHRMQVLFGLLRLDPNEQVVQLLKEFAKEGGKEEAVLATRALCGYKVVNLGEFGDESVRRQIAQTCERAAGQVFFWIRRDELPSLKGA